MEAVDVKRRGLDLFGQTVAHIVTLNETITHCVSLQFLSKCLWILKLKRHRESVRYGRIDRHTTGGIFVFIMV